MIDAVRSRLDHDLDVVDPGEDLNALAVAMADEPARELREAAFERIQHVLIDAGPQSVVKRPRGVARLRRAARTRKEPRVNVHEQLCLVDAERLVAMLGRVRGEDLVEDQVGEAAAVVARQTLARRQLVADLVDELAGGQQAAQRRRQRVDGRRVGNQVIAQHDRALELQPVHTVVDDVAKQARCERRASLVEHVHAEVEPRAVCHAKGAVPGTETGRLVEQHGAIAEHAQQIRGHQAARARADHDRVDPLVRRHTPRT